MVFVINIMILKNLRFYYYEVSFKVSADVATSELFMRQQLDSLAV